MSFTKLESLFPLAMISAKLSLAFCESSPAIPSISDSDIPMIPFRGVLSSCDVFARNSSCKKIQSEILSQTAFFIDSIDSNCAWSFSLCKSFILSANAKEIRIDSNAAPICTEFSVKKFIGIKP